MGLISAPARRPPGAGTARDLVSRVLAFISTIVAGVLIGIQYWDPNKRVLPVIATLFVLGVAWRLSMAAAINVLVFLLPYPKGTVFGNTNLAFVLILFVIWLLRLSLRMSPPARFGPLTFPISALILWFILSFYNVRDADSLDQGMRYFELFLACVIMYFVVINSVRTQKDLERLHIAQLVTALGVFLLGVWEARHAGQVLIPGLIDFSATMGHDFNTRDVRVGSSFRDFELLSEYCGLYLLLALFLAIRARSATQRFLFSAAALFSLYTLFTTVTRGVIFALGLALPTVIYTIRRRVNPVRFVTGAVVLAAFFIGMNFFVAHYTNSGDLFLRLSETKVVNGVVPEARQVPWLNAWKRALVHPILGNGPPYREMPGYLLVWPHNLYLFVANLVGFPGLFFFLMILFGLFRMLRPTVDDLRHESYADAYLIIARTQLIVLCFNELKIDFMRNQNYEFQAWLLFATWTAAYLISREQGVTAGYHTAAPAPAPLARAAA